MYLQKIATILMDDVIHDILNEGNEYGFQEYIFMSEIEDILSLRAELIKLKEKQAQEQDVNNVYLGETIKEIDEVLPLLENQEIENIVFVYQN